MSLERFKKAQNDSVSGYALALAELKSGRKTSHWIWYVLPQLASLGRSPTAQFYGIQDLDEARTYLRDPLLRDRLIEAFEVIAAQLEAGVSLGVLMGSTTDSVKLASSATLFQITARTLLSTETNPEASRMILACERILSAIETQGVPCCTQTVAACAAMK